MWCVGDAAVDITDLTIRGNTVDTGSSYGINIDYCQRPQLHGNRVQTIGTNDAYRLANSHNVVFGKNYQDGSATGSRVDVSTTDFYTETFTNTDATPAVGAGSYFETFTNVLTITDFDEGTAGQMITVVSKGAITYDVTSTDLKGGTVDLVTASGDVTQWICEDGATWRLISFMDMSDDYSSGM
jgi:hypothetical protein